MKKKLWEKLLSGMLSAALLISTVPYAPLSASAEVLGTTGSLQIAGARGTVYGYTYRNLTGIQPGQDYSISYNLKNPVTSGYTFSLWSCKDGPTGKSVGPVIKLFYDSAKSKDYIQIVNGASKLNLTANCNLREWNHFEFRITGTKFTVYINGKSLKNDDGSIYEYPLTSDVGPVQLFGLLGDVSDNWSDGTALFDNILVQQGDKTLYSENFNGKTIDALKTDGWVMKESTPGAFITMNTENAAAASPDLPVDSGYPQLIQNSSFEDGAVGSLPDNWKILSGSDTANGTAVLSGESGYIRLGKYSLKMSYKGSSTYGIISDAVKVTPGESYRLNIHSKSPLPTGKYSAYLNFYDKDGALLGKSPVYGTGASGGWSYVSTNTASGILAATAPANAVSAKYVITLGTEGTSTDSSFYFDSATLIHLDKTVSTVLNSGFENGIDGNTGLPANYDVWEWTDVDKGTQTLTTAKAYEGSSSVLLSNVKGVGQNSIRSGLVAAAPQTDYNFSARVFTVNGSSHPVLRAYAYDANGAQIGLKDITTTQMTDTWEYAKGTWNTPANTAFVAVSVYQYRTVDSSTAYIDNMSIILTSADVDNVINASLVNPGFENGAQSNGLPNNWVVWPNNAQSKVTIDTDTVHNGTGYNGTHSLKLVDDSASATSGLASEPIQVAAGKKYRASAWVYNESGSGVSLYMNFYKSKADALAGNGRINTTVPNSYVSELSGWKQVTIEGVAPADAVCATVGFYEGEKTVSVSYADDVIFMQVPDTAYPDSIQNPNFEDGYTDSGSIKSWNKYSSSSDVKLSKDCVYQGEYSVRMSAIAPNGCGLRSNPVAATPGVNYQVKSMVYNEIGSSEIYLEFWNSSKSRLSTSIVGTSRTRQWQEISVEGTAPAGTAYATVLFYQRSDVSGIAYADSVSLTPYTAAPEISQHFTSIAGSHPKVFFTANDLANLRAKANDAEKTVMGNSGKELADQIIASADKYLTETSFKLEVDNVYGSAQSITISVPPVEQVVSPKQPSGYTNYPFWTAISRGLEDRMEILSMAYHFTGNESYARKAVDIAVALAGWNTWHDPADTGVTTNLDTAHIVLGVSAVYDMCYSYMAAREQQKLQNALIYLGLNPLYADAKTKVDHNIQALRASALTTGALALMGDVDSALTDKYLTRSVEYFKWYLKEREESGNQEGFGYTSYALENMIDAFDQLARVTGYSELIKNDYLNNTLVKWVINFSAPGSYSLAQVSDFYGGSGFYQTFSVLANNGNGLAGWYLANAKPGNSVLLTKQFLYLNKNMPIQEPSKTMPNSIFLSQIGWGALRTGWKPFDTLLGLISNNTGLGHNHYDQNSFLIATNGTWIAGDPGYSTFDKTQTSLLEFNGQAGHNTILVDWVKNTTTGAQVYKGGGSLTSNISTSAYSYMIGSAPEAYGDNVLNCFDRHAIMLNHSGRPYYVLFDDLNSAKDRTYTWSLYPGGKWDALTVDGKAVSDVESSQSGNQIKVSRNSTSLYAQFVGNDALQVDTGMYLSTQGTQTEKDAQGPYIHVSNKVKSSSYNFMSILNTYSDSYLIPASIFYPTMIKDDNCTSTYVNDTAVFRGETGAGAKVSYTFNVAEDGEYDVSLIIPKSWVYGIYQASIDGVNCGEPYDGYNPTIVMGNTQELSKMSLTAGTHTITFTCVGKNAAATQSLNGVTTIKLTNTAADKSLDSAVTVSHTIDNANALGAVINYASDAHDLILFNRTDSAISEADVTTNAKQISLVSVKEDGSMEGIGMNGGTSLVYGGKTLLTSTASVSVYVDYIKNTLTVDASTDANVTLNLKNGPITLSVKSGSSTIDFTADYSAVDSALSKIPADLSKYTDASVKILNDAVAAVVRKYDLSRQNNVNAMAEAIENAIKSLSLISGPTPVKITDSATGIIIESEANVLPADTKLAIEQITQGEKYDRVRQSLSEKVQQFTLFDISLLSGGKEIEPDGKVKVTMPIPAGYDSSRIALYHIADDGTITGIEFTVQDSNIIFTVDGFSMYTVAELKKETDSSSSVPDSSSQQPDSNASSQTGTKSPTTGDNTVTALYAAIMLTSLAAVLSVVLANKRRNKMNRG